MKLNKSILLFLITILLFSLLSCSKDSDTTGPVATYAIQGKIVDDSNNGFEGVIITVSRNKFAKTDTTSVEGAYSIDGISNGEYTLTPKKLGYMFSPENLKITIKDSDLVVQNIKATLIGYTVFGAVVDSTGSGLLNVNVKIINKNNQLVNADSTDSEGKYSISDISIGDYIVKPKKVGYVFEPSEWDITITGANLSISDITASFVGAVVEGKIVHSFDDSVEDIAVYLTSETIIDSLKTDSDGSFKFYGLPEGTYSIAYHRGEYLFYPDSTQFSVNNENWGNQIILEEITATQIPDAPVLNEPVIDYNRVTLIWNLVKYATTYIVEKAENDAFDGAEKWEVVDTSKTFSYFQAVEETFYYRIRAKNSDGESDWSNTVSITISNYITMVSIPAGSFEMGSSEGDINEKPVHTVTLDAFEISIFEITQRQYNELVGRDPSHFKSGDDYPVENVNWYYAVIFCNLLSDKTGLERCYNKSTWECDFSKNGFRLPTEAEWEYACRAGTTTLFYTGDSESDIARAGWYLNNSSSKTNYVGQKEPNGWGLYDMHGNVWEWCHDRYGLYSSDSQMNPTGTILGYKRVLRGGSWSSNAGYCRSTFRHSNHPSNTNSNFGFRVVRRP